MPREEGVALDEDDVGGVKAQRSKRGHRGEVEGDRAEGRPRKDKKAREEG